MILLALFALLCVLLVRGLIRLNLRLKAWRWEI